MKKTFLTLGVLLSLSNADEISRINALVTEVHKLRVGYDSCQEQLQMLQKQKPTCKKTNKKEYEVLRKKVSSLDENITRLQKENDALRTKLAKVQKEKEALEKSLKNQKKALVHEDSNKQENIKNEKQIQTHITKPKTFRTLREAYIYDAPKGKVVAKWEKGRSFTSYMDAGEWVKITGYFINKKWTPAQKELWIKRADAFER